MSDSFCIAAISFFIFSHYFGLNCGGPESSMYCNLRKYMQIHKHAANSVPQHNRGGGWGYYEGIILTAAALVVNSTRSPLCFFCLSFTLSIGRQREEVMDQVGMHMLFNTFNFKKSQLSIVSQPGLCWCLQHVGAFAYFFLSCSAMISKDHYIQ